MNLDGGSADPSTVAAQRNVARKRDRANEDSHPMPSIKAQLIRGVIAGIVAMTGAMTATFVGFSWGVLVSGPGLSSLFLAAVAFVIAGIIVFSGDVSALRAGTATLAGHVAAIAVAVPVALLMTPLTPSVLPATFSYVVAGVVIASLLCGGRLNLPVIGSAVAIVLASAAVPVQGGDLCWSMWFALVIAAWTIIPILSRHAAESLSESHP